MRILITHKNHENYLEQLMNKYLDKFLQLIRLKSKEVSVRDTLEELIEEPSDQISDDDLPEIERELLGNVLKLRDLKAFDVMIPRVDIQSIGYKESFGEIKKILQDKLHSRMPICKNNKDDIAGMVHLKDIFELCVNAYPDNKSLPKNIIRPILFVSPSMPAQDLLLKMRLSRKHMAIVVDEFGGVDGLITIEDLIEEIVGEIKDEHDHRQEPEFYKETDGSIIIDARYMIEDFEEVFTKILTLEEREEDIDTLGGLVFYLAGHVPARGELIKHSSGVEFEILEVDPRKVKKIKVKKLQPLLDEDKG